MLCTPYEASWNVNKLDEVPKTIDMLKWMGGLSCRKAFDLHSMIVSRCTQPFPRAGLDFPPSACRRCWTDITENCQQRRDWLPGCKRELEKGIRFLTPCSSCHSLPSSKIFNDFLLLKGLKASPGWYFRLSLICPLWGITKHFHAYYLIWSSQYPHASQRGDFVFPFYR